MASRICWHCKTKTHMRRIGEPHATGTVYQDQKEPSTWFAWYICDECHYASLAQTAVHPRTLIERYWHEPRVQGEAERGTYQSQAEVAASFWFEEGVGITWYPQVGHGKEYEDMDEHIASAASEAYSCHYINSYRAAVLMARTTVEAIAKDKGITNGNLKSKIEQMGEKNFISPQLEEEAHEIRYLGNEMAHGDLDSSVEEEDAADILGFMDTMIDYVYQQPRIIERRRMLRDKRKGRQTE